MGFFDDKEDHYNQYNDAMESGNHASMGHEVLAGGAAFTAMKVFEDRQRKEGKPVSHQFAKELIAGFAGAEVDKLAETKGEDWFDRRRAKRDAEDQATQMYEQHYEQQYDQYDPNQAGPPPQLQRYGNW